MATTNSTDLSLLETVCLVEDVFHRHILPFLTATDLSRLEATSRSQLRVIVESSQAWRSLCERDFVVVPEQECLAPVYSTSRQSFDETASCESWKVTYKNWSFWNRCTCNGAQAKHMIQAIDVWRRFKAWLEEQNLQNILDSLAPCPPRNVFEQLVGRAPSSYIAFYSVHGGQRALNLRSSSNLEFFAGMLGCYTCYNMFYAMRGIHLPSFGNEAISIYHGTTACLVALSVGNPRSFLLVRPSEDDPEGEIFMTSSIASLANIRPHQIVGHGGILSYFQTYVERLEAGVYDPAPVIPNMPTSRGISLFPNGGSAMSCAVTRGIEVRASARWFPDSHGLANGINFGYSIRIRMVAHLPEASTCQLVGRHWEFTDGNGSVRRVDGEAVVGKQPLFFLEDGKSGYVDLGEAGDDERYSDTVFVYQSQSGHVRGTSPQDTKSASVRGTFSFRPGSIEEPAGPVFHVTVAPFPLKVSIPFY